MNLRSLITCILLLCAGTFTAGAKSPMEVYLSDQANAPRLAADIFHARAIVDSLTTALPIEGIWQMTTDANDGIFAVIADKSTSYLRMIVVDSPDRRVRPGEVMGVILPAAAKGYYDAYIHAKVGRDGSLSAPKRFTMKLDGDRLIIRPVKHYFKVNFWRLIPYMRRLTITEINDRNNNLDGAVRLYPTPQSPHNGPRML